MFRRLLLLVAFLVQLVLFALPPEIERFSLETKSTGFQIGTSNLTETV